MGQKQSSQVIKEEYINDNPINHPRFNQARLVKSKEGDYIQISVPAISEADIKKWTQQYKLYYNHESLMFPLSYDFKGTQICGSNGFCTINYDYYPFILKDQIADRISTERKYFQNEELWYLCFTILEAANIFHSTGRRVGDIRPLNIFINDQGQTKIGNQLTWPSEFTNYEKAIFNKQVTFLAPEQIKDLHFGHLSPTANYECAQSFAVGLTLLDSVLLTDSTDLYNMSNNRFDYKKLEQKINMLLAQTWLDGHLKQIIAGLCRLQQAERFKCRELYSWLSKYKEAIINIEHFQIQEVPQYFGSNTLQVQQNSTIIQNTRQVNSEPIYFESQVVTGPPQQVIYSKQKIQTKLCNQSQSGQYLSIVPQTQSEDFRLTLQKIEEQLAISRKMFPS